MTDPASVNNIHSPWPTPSGTVEDMQSGNLQVHVPAVAEDMNSGGLQHYVAEKMQSGGIQPYDSYSDKEGLPPAIQEEKITAELSSKRRICGLSRSVFGLLTALFVLIVIGAVVGGVVGMQKRQSNASANSPLTGSSPQISITSTTSSPSSTSAISSLAPSTTISTSIVTSSTSSASPNTTTGLPFITPSRANPTDVDGNYFVNCNDTQGSLSSGMAYYSYLTPGNNTGHVPNDYTVVTNGSYVTWENGGTVKFKTGVALHWSTLHNLGTNQRAGTSDNGYENFFVYEDTGALLYTVGTWSCYSMYWAF